jgi:glycosyltransferase involved in cell wall biosynthesis
VPYTSRSESLARQVSAENHFIVPGKSLGPLKFVVRAFATMGLLLRKRPRVVFAMNMPVFCPLVALVYCKLFGAQLVLDVHSGAYNKAQWRKFLWLHDAIAKRARVSLATNSTIGQFLEDAGAPEVLNVPDIPFELPRGEYAVADGFTLCMIALYDVDEPVAELFEVARRMPDATFYVTGNSAKAPRELVASKPDNVVLTGFIPKNDYGELLQRVSAIAALTTRDDTMQRGGSEAISASKPLVTSDWPILKEIFYKGACYCDNTIDGIEAAVREVREQYDRYLGEMGAMHDERQARWEETQAAIEALLDDGHGDG